LSFFAKLFKDIQKNQSKRTQTLTLQHKINTGIFFRSGRFWIEAKCLYRLSDILLTGLFTYLNSGENYDDMALFAKSHKEFLRPYAVYSMAFLLRHIQARIFVAGTGIIRVWP
jgi:hypothetical protein